MRTLFLVVLAFVAGCNRDSAPNSNLPTIPLKIGDRQFTLEVVDSDADRRYGLMRRDSLPADRGMIFVFAQEAHLAFYMKNTKIPLDILYVDQAGKIVSIKQMKPFDLETTPSDFPALYAIELNQGTAAKIGAKVGDTLQLPATLKARD